MLLEPYRQAHDRLDRHMLNRRGTGDELVIIGKCRIVRSYQLADFINQVSINFVAK